MLTWLKIILRETMGLGNVYMHYIPQKVKKKKRFRITKHYIIIYENIDPIWKQNGFQNKKICN